MGDDQLLNLQPGTVVNGRYEIVKCLGTGSMGMVYACRHRELSGHLVAMKVLFAEVARDPVAAARFRNEIVASYGVNHPNVVRAYEYFRDGDLIAYTMEYVGGGDLADRISMDQGIPVAEIVRLLSQMCAGVQAIHSAGIIHRDLKPENILITPEKDIKITDFGIARTGTGPRLTEHGGVVGTIDYVSPEYLERGQVDARSDIYALGVLGYEMITGETPFKGKSVIETMTMRLRSDPEPPHSLRQDCPEALSEIILHAMARDPEKRYQAAAEMLRDLSMLSADPNHVLIPGAAPVLAHVPEAAPASPVVRRVPGESPGSNVTPLNRTSAQRNHHQASGAHHRKLAPYYQDVEHLEPVLRPEAESGGIKPAEALKNMAIQPVSVSQSHLSVERIREITSDLSQDGDHMARTVFVAFVIMMLGFAAGFYILSKEWQRPDMFPLGTNQEVPSEEIN